MLPRRIYLNLAAFALLFVVLCGWAVQNVLRPDLLSETYRVEAAFADATGLRTGVEVTLRGVRIGRVASVTLLPSQADVAMDIDSAVEVPNGSGAAVRRRSAVGEPYVAIEPPPGWHDGDPIVPTNGYRIPLDATSTPLAYGDLFAAADSFLQAVDPASLGTVTRELADALEGRGEVLAQLVDASSDSLSTLADGEAELRALGEGLTTLTHTVAERSPTIADATDDLGAIVETVAVNADDVQTLLDETPALADRMNAILASSYAQVLCGTDAAATISSVLGAEETVAQIVRLLQAAETASVVIPLAIYEGPDGRYLSGTFGFAPGEISEYDAFEEFAEPPALPTCVGDPPAAATPTADSAVADRSLFAAGSDSAPPAEVADGDAAADPTGTPRANPPGSSPLPALAAAILALAVAVGTVAALRGRWASRSSRSGSGPT